MGGMSSGGESFLSEIFGRTSESAYSIYLQSGKYSLVSNIDPQMLVSAQSNDIFCASVALQRTN